MAASTLSIHSRQRAAAGKSASSTSRSSSLSRRRRRGAAVIGRTAGTLGRPESSRAAPSATSRSNSRRAARPVIGAWRAASAGRDAILGEQQVDNFGRRFRPQFGRDGDQGVRAAARDRRRGRGPRRRPTRSRPRRRLARRARPALAAGSPMLTADWDPEVSWRSAAGVAASAAGWRGSGRRSRAREPPPPGMRRRRRLRRPRRRLWRRRRRDCQHSQQSDASPRRGCRDWAA